MQEPIIYINGGTMLASHTWDADQLWAGNGTVTISPTAILTIAGLMEQQSDTEAKFLQMEKYIRDSWLFFQIMWK
ncbi:hypothetical protein QUF70_18205 [Desulfobacterales bacterium HSG17]|nr:hypothetical protein [Desulfobacterales bacterium HSG17]